jgi:UDPglucose 6-dehydrogenase
MRPSPWAHGTIGILGLGYMGLATGLAFAAHHRTVVGFDSNPKVLGAVAHGRAPYHEAGLRELLESQLRRKRFQVAGSIRELAQRSEGIFLCVPTPSRPDGGIDLGPVERASTAIGEAIGQVEGFRIVVVKSTVVPGTTDSVVAKAVLAASRRADRDVDVAANPEFLAEGSMVEDALHPARVVIGTHSSRAEKWLRRAYGDFGAPIFALTPAGAELVKYSANSFLALKVSFANEISRVADYLEVNIDQVMAAVGHDPRIGSRFLRAGPGFGGSCFEKDIRALVRRSERVGLAMRSGKASLRINEDQLRYVVARAQKILGSLTGMRISMLGLAFKAGTDDARESRALPLMRDLVRKGAFLRAHDPVAIDNFKRIWSREVVKGGRGVKFCTSVSRALEGADLAILQADWPMYLNWSRRWSRAMRHPVVLDLRRCLDLRVAKAAGLTVYGLGAGLRPECPISGTPGVGK